MANPLGTFYILPLIFLIGCSFRIDRSTLKSLSHSTESKQYCNITNFEFHSNRSFAYGRELNRTFAKINERIESLDNVSYQINESVKYVIYEAKPTFYYNQDNQISQIVGDDVIVISNGWVQMQIQFKWAKVGQNNKTGSGSVKGKSKNIEMALRIDIDDEFIKFYYLDSTPFQCDQLNLSKIDQSLTLEQRQAIIDLLYNSKNITTLKTQLQNQVNLVYVFYLYAYANQENQPFDRKFFYQWNKSPNERFVVNFIRRPTTFYIQRLGMEYGFETIIDGFQGQKCGPQIPVLPLNTYVYGGAQSFTSYTFYENLLTFAIKNNQLDTVLSRNLWSTNKFKFYASDLYNIFNGVSSQFSANMEVLGSCKADPTNLTVIYKTEETLNVSYGYSCEISIIETKIVDFNLKLAFEIQGKPNSSTVDFWMKSYKAEVTYQTVPNFKLTNKSAADQIINDSLDRIRQSKLFGSGWPVYPIRNNTKFMTLSTSTVVY